MRPSSVREIATLAELKTFARETAANLAVKQVLLLNGPMGAGKTQFTRFLLEAMGSDEVVSPSFAIHNSYTTASGDVEHVDLYRLENDDELESTGFWDLFSSASGLIIIEWAERLPKGSLPPSWKQTHLTFEITGANSRRVTVS